MERLRKHKLFLNKFVNSKQKQKTIKEASRGEICTVCEVIKNIVHNPTLKLNPSPKQQATLRKNSKKLKTLIDKRVNTTKKRDLLLQRGSGIILPLIAALAGPILSKLLK